MPLNQPARGTRHWDTLINQNFATLDQTIADVADHETRITTLEGSSGGITVREVDGSPAMTATVIEVSNGTLTDQGSGVARITTGGGGGGGGVAAAAIRAALASDQALNNSGNQKVQLTSEQIDTDGTYDAATAIWTPAAGTYLIHVQLMFGSAGSNRNVILFKNGAQLVDAWSHMAAVASDASVSLTYLDTASGTDTYEVYVWSNATLTLRAQRTYFQAYRIA